MVRMRDVGGGVRVRGGVREVMMRAGGMAAGGGGGRQGAEGSAEELGAVEDGELDNLGREGHVRELSVRVRGAHQRRPKYHPQVLRRHLVVLRLLLNPAQMVHQNF